MCVCVCVCFRGCKYSTRRPRKNLRVGEKNKWMNSEKKCHSRGGLEDNKHKNHWSNTYQTKTDEDKRGTLHHVLCWLFFSFFFPNYLLCNSGFNIYISVCLLCACILKMCQCARVSPICVHAAKTWTWMWDLFIFFFLLAVSRKCYQKRSPMNWRPLHWELKLHEKKSLQHESRENAAGNKSTDSSVCVFMYCERVCVCVCNCYLASESREGIKYQVTLWIAAEKPSSNNVLL